MPPDRTSSGEAYFAGSNFAPSIFSHSAFVISDMPLPLQAFWPAQALPAVLHAPLPLQALPPTQWPLASSAAKAGAETAPVISKAAAAAAMAEPDFTEIFMDLSFH